MAPAIILSDPAAQTGPARGRPLLRFTGETFKADRAAEIGLVTMAVEDVSSAVDDLVADLGKASPQGLAASRR